MTAALALTACTSFGDGAISTSALEERQAAAHYLWAIRGRDLGALIREYCLNATRPQRRHMFETAIQHAGTAKFVIICGETP